jgi:hypothetical protein
MRFPTKTMTISVVLEELSPVLHRSVADMYPTSWPIVIFCHCFHTRIRDVSHSVCSTLYTPLPIYKLYPLIFMGSDWISARRIEQTKDKKNTRITHHTNIKYTNDALLTLKGGTPTSFLDSSVFSGKYAPLLHQTKCKLPSTTKTRYEVIFGRRLA